MANSSIRKDALEENAHGKAFRLIKDCVSNDHLKQPSPSIEVYFIMILTCW